MLEGYGSSRLHGRKSHSGDGGQRRGLTKKYVEHRDSILELLEHKFGCPFDRRVKGIVTHLTSKKQFDETICAEMLEWKVIGQDALEKHAESNLMYGRMKRVRVRGFACVRRRTVKKDEMNLLEANTNTFRKFILHNERLPAAQKVSLATIARYELGEWRRFIL